MISKKYILINAVYSAIMSDKSDKQDHFHRWITSVVANVKVIINFKWDIGI